MSQRQQTKDQRFMVTLYQRAIHAGDIYTSFNRYEIGNSVGLQKRAVDTICRDLLLCNFLRKEGSDGVYLTKNGENLVLEFLQAK